ncbi:MAG: response regulator, partial [Candidatus Kariarchaeaceae archaeon]
YDVLIAVDGIDSIKVFKENADEIGLVLLDITMPKMRGDIVFQKMQEIDAEVPIILMSGYSEQEALDSATAKNMAGFLQKPYNADTLLACVQDVLS